MNNYCYKCFECGKEFSSQLIEENFIYLCPDCGLTEKNKPLSGVLTIIYDYNNIKKEIKTDVFGNQTPGTLSYLSKLLPLKKNFESQLLNNLRLPSYNLITTVYCDLPLILMDETRNITLSYKDRASILVGLKALELGVAEIACASTGNAGSSMAGISARIGIKSNIYVPENIPQEKYLQIKMYGANVVKVKGDYDLAFDECLADSIKNKWYNRNTAYNPLTIEGKKTAAYDLFLQSNGKLPDIIFIPVGDGVIISGMYKGFWELKELGLIEVIPKLIAVQAEGSSAVADYFRKGEFNYKPASSIADSICAGAPRNLYMAVDAIRNSGGDTVLVSDEEILDAQKELAGKFGIIAEPSAAATFAGYIKKASYKNITGRISMLLITGNGMKDVGSLSNVIN